MNQNGYKAVIFLFTCKSLDSKDKTHVVLAHFCCRLFVFQSGTIPPIKSARGEGDDVKKLFSIGSPVILVTLGAALLFIIRKKRKEKRLKRLRGEGGQKTDSLTTTSDV